MADCKASSVLFSFNSNGSATCTICKKTLSSKIQYSLERHLKVQHPQQYQRADQELKMQGVQFTNNLSKNETFRQLQVRFFVTANLPFLASENRFYRQMLLSLNNTIAPIGADTLKADVTKLASDYKNSVKKCIETYEPQVLILDGWTNRNNSFTLYGSLVSYRDADGEMHQKLFNLTDLPGGKTDSIIESLRLSFKQNLDVSLSDFQFLVSDAAANMTSLAKKQGFKHIVCVCHQLHLSVSATLKLKGINELLLKCKLVAQRISKSSSTRNEYLKNSSNKCTPKNFSATRWGGMNQLFLSVKMNIGVIGSCATLADIIFTLSDRELLDNITLMLEPIEIMSTKMQSQHSLASEIVPRLIVCLEKINEAYDAIDLDKLDAVSKKWTIAFKKSLIGQLEQRKWNYEESVALQYCTLFDPRFSFKSVLFYDAWLDIEESFISLLPKEDFATNENETTPMVRKQDSKKMKYNDELAEFLVEYSAPPAKITIQKQAKKEFRSYKKMIEDTPRDANQSVYWFWRNNAKRFPCLAKFAFQYISVPGSSSSIERIFSNAGRVTANRLRCRMTAETCSDVLYSMAASITEITERLDDDYGVIEDIDIEKTQNEMNSDILIDVDDDGNAKPCVPATTA